MCPLLHQKVPLPVIKREELGNGWQLLGKLADKTLVALPGIIGLILSWILNRAKEVIGWLSQNFWALITGVGVLIYTFFMTKARRR